MEEAKTFYNGLLGSAGVIGCHCCALHRPRFAAFLLALGPTVSF
jgi:hypothetical protein